MRLLGSGRLVPCPPCCGPTPVKRNVAASPGHGVGSAGLKRVRWTLSAGGALRREYRYALEGDFVYHGVTFDHRAGLMSSLRWLGEGPFRVGENCLQGTGCGVQEAAGSEAAAGGLRLSRVSGPIRGRALGTSRHPRRTVDPDVGVAGNLSGWGHAAHQPSADDGGFSGGRPFVPPRQPGQRFEVQESGGRGAVGRVVACIGRLRGPGGLSLRGMTTAPIELRRPARPIFPRRPAVG